MHMRRRVPFLKIVPLDAVLAKLGITKPQLIVAQIMHFVLGKLAREMMTVAVTRALRLMDL